VGDGRACQDAAAAGELEVLTDFESEDDDFESDFADDSDFDDELSDELLDESELEDPDGTAPARLSVR
jgi:hypothetical protein